MLHTMRHIQTSHIGTEEIKTAIQTKTVDKIIKPYDEIDIMLDNEKMATVVCGYSSPSMARFAFKNCWSGTVMYNEDHHDGGYYNSKGRRHVLKTILPHFPKEWRDIIKPRKLTEEINGQKVEYEDDMWLFSATDVFGPPKDEIDELRKNETDSFRLPIFVEAEQRIKTLKNKPCHYWLRTACMDSPFHFEIVDFNGMRCSGWVDCVYKIVPGFDIG